MPPNKIPRGPDQFFCVEQLGTFCNFFAQKKRGIHSFAFTQLVIPTALLPITKLGVIRIPITLPRGAAARWRAFKRAMRLSRTGTDAGNTLMHWRRGFSNLFSHRGSHRSRKKRRSILRQAQRQTHVLTRDLLRRTSKILRVLRRRKAQ